VNLKKGVRSTVSRDLSGIEEVPRLHAGPGEAVIRITLVITRGCQLFAERSDRVLKVAIKP
jgi:hypothetical protein